MAFWFASFFRRPRFPFDKQTKFNDTHTHLVVDFDRPELCAACDPVECYVRGEALYFRSNWRDLLVSLLSRLIAERHPALREFNRAGVILANAPFFKETKEACNGYDARILPNGRWIIVHYSIPTLIKIIDKICKICGILRSEIKITYRPKGSAPSNSSSPAPAANVSQTPSRSQTSSASPATNVSQAPVANVAQTRDDAGELIVDFTQPEKCAGCDPVECYFRGEPLPFQSNWRDIIVALLERLIDEQNPGIERFRTIGLTGLAGRVPFFKSSQEECYGHGPRQLSNGYWIITDYSISYLVTMIERICGICQIPLSDVKITYRPKSDAKPENDRATQIVDLAQPEKYADCRPFECYFRGEALAFGKSWADVLEAVVERLIAADVPQLAELYHSSLNERSQGLPFFHQTKPCSTLTSRRLSNGAWIIASVYAPSTLKTLREVLEFCQIPISDLKITYRPKSNTNLTPSPVVEKRNATAPVTSVVEQRQDAFPKVSAPARKSNEAFPSVARKALQTDYANGFRFNESTLRLFAEKIGFALDAATVARMKKEMFCRDDLYFLPETVADLKTTSEIIATVGDWLRRFEMFDLSRLYERFESRLNAAAIRNLEDFERYVAFSYNDSTIRCFDKWKARFLRVGGRSQKELFTALFERLRERVAEEGGTLDEYALTDAFPAFTFDELSRVAKESGEELVVTAINDVACVQTFDALGLPDDFESALTATLDELAALDLTPTEDALHVALSLRFGFNFNVQYNLTETKTYRRLIELNYTGTTPRRWKGGVFGEISETDE